MLSKNSHLNRFNRVFTFLDVPLSEMVIIMIIIIMIVIIIIMKIITITIFKR